MLRERQPVIRIKSDSFPPLANHAWAKAWRSWCG
jgi:hypothetical protein